MARWLRKEWTLWTGQENLPGMDWDREAMRKHPQRNPALRSVCTSCRSLRGGSRRGRWELEEKPAWAALGSGSVKGAWKMWRKPEAILGILGFVFCRQAGASPVIQQRQRGRETSLAECSFLWQAEPRFCTEICSARLTQSTMDPLGQLGWGCSRFAFSRKALTQDWAPLCKRNAFC